MEVTIKTAAAHEAQQNSAAAQKELEAVQEYVREHVGELAPDAIHFIPLQGDYTHIRRKLVLSGVLVSMMQGRVTGIQGRLHTSWKESEGEAADMVFSFPPEFLGSLATGEGFPIHFEIPVKGLSEDMRIPSSRLECALNDVKILVTEQKEHEHDADRTRKNEKE